MPPSLVTLTTLEYFRSPALYEIDTSCQKQYAPSSHKQGTSVALHPVVRARVHIILRSIAVVAQVRIVQFLKPAAKCSR